ncbi:VOC family protein [Chromobacterium violaceum]|uniref:Glyoxalase-like domain n=1 Tax=Chromobacterium violaceum TaxID=536 RepID=A0A381ET62_CHRVL|nr:VOC family protein [Chromobacterium violaceum]ATP30747.1 glyoxalase [Chromobacterium violaceum]ATP34655.1 glyoxalase [Chromobacterium violaceum]MCD0493995.1 VOC family protein [Chromobacterium violaceum]OLZ82392.1 glyoxalase [Chromobacterium violaceum]OQS09070.1 glyoxalase [Chromobacterium violaceum]
MAIEVQALHHVGFSVPKHQVAALQAFYGQVFGLEADPSRWHIPGVPGCFLDFPNATQLHIMGKDGVSPYAQGEGQDPVSNHVALTVASLERAAAELKERGIAFFSQRNVAADRLEQLFVRDPAGNLLELRQGAG